jgi:hypothetical protein
MFVAVAPQIFGLVNGGFIYSVCSLSLPLSLITTVVLENKIQN